MKRILLILVVGGISMVGAGRASAQFGNMIPFKRPNIANFFHPVAGAGTQYEETGKDGRKAHIEVAIVDKEMVGAQQGYWIEFGSDHASGREIKYIKALITPDDFRAHQVVTFMEQNNQLTQIDVDSLPANHDAFTKDLAKWHQVGSESVTVPAGTFSCDHWVKDDGSGDIWVSSKVAPMGMVKSVDKNDTTVLVKTFSDAKTHLTGNPVKLDLQQMMMMNRGMQQHP